MMFSFLLYSNSLVLQPTFTYFNGFLGITAPCVRPCLPTGVHGLPGFAAARLHHILQQLHYNILIFQRIQELFYGFADMDSQIKDRIIQDCPVAELAEIAFALFHTPVTVFDKFEKILMMAYDPARPENLEFYQNRLYFYMPEDERCVLYTDQDFAASLETRGASWFRSDIYRQDIIFYNIFYSGTLYHPDH